MGEHQCLSAFLPWPNARATFPWGNCSARTACEIKPEGITFRARNDRYNIVVTGNRWFDNKAGLGGLGAIDLQMHLTGEDFAAAYQTLARDFRGISTAEIGLSFPIERYIPYWYETQDLSRTGGEIRHAQPRRTGRLPAPISSKHARSTPPLWTICTRWERSSPTTTVLIQARRGDPNRLKRGRFEDLTMRGLEGMRGPGSALLRRGGSADAVILGTQNAAGEWVAIAAATPLSPPQYLAKSTRMDLEFLAVSGPQKRGNGKSTLRLALSENSEAAF